MNLDGFAKAIAEDWRMARSAQVTKPPLSISDLQEKADFFFGNSGLGVLYIATSLEKCSYKFNFQGMGGTPFSVLAARQFDEWLHLALIHVHTAFVRGLPIQPSLGELNEMRQFAALTYTRATSSTDLFPLGGTTYWVFSPNYKPVVVSLGYILVQLSLDNKMTVIRGFLLDYLYGSGRPDAAFAKIEHFYDNIAAA
jgi:hypothetical protein